ncbi:type 4a pilus biogenesis protein PilO [Oceanisphaera sp.]|uniref:type 4a pilus biogenesis protein PilO n=1 Tax=Oceanisphaera sp. TaxID=1929979 RepID=UPI003A9190BD
MNWSLHELDLELVEQWPATARIMLFVLLSGVLCLAGGYVFLADHWTQWQQSRQQEIELKRIFIQKSQMAASLPAYQHQVEQLQEQLQTGLQQLPSQRDAARVLKDLSELAERNGLSLGGFQWEAEQQLDLATELPLRIKARGQYHQLGHFIAQVSALPRIVIIDGIELTRPDTPISAEGLHMTLLAKTYAYRAGEASTTP